MNPHNSGFRFGPARYFVPICIRHAHGFQGGPAGYLEMTLNMARAQSPIILPAALSPKIRIDGSGYALNDFSGQITH